MRVAHRLNLILLAALACCILLVLSSIALGMRGANQRTRDAYRGEFFELGIEAFAASVTMVHASIQRQLVEGRDLASAVRLMAEQSNGYLQLYDAQGQLVFGRDLPAELRALLTPAELEALVFEYRLGHGHERHFDNLGEAMEGQQRPALARAQVFPEGVVVYARLLEASDARLAYLQGQDQKRLLQTLFTVGVICLLGLFIIAVIVRRALRRRLLRPLEAITAAVQHFGDHGTTMELREDASADVELALLGSAFCTMAERLAGERGRLEALVAERTAAFAAACDRAEAANRAKSQFLATMSHEIRTPLNAILGYAQMLCQDEDLSAEQSRAVEVINRSGDHLLQLISDILDMARVESGNAENEPDHIDLPLFLDQVASLFSARIHDQGLKWELDYDAQLPRHIRIDQRKLRQILLNLLSNALKFTERGGIALIATRGTAEHGDERLYLSVRDSGPGLNDDEQARLFQAFSQVGDGRRRGGAGLGLAISRGFAQVMGGDLSLRSQAGAGATFTLDLPLEAVDGAVSTPSSARVLGLAPGQRRPRILIAEDHVDSREVLTALMQRAGCQVRAVGDGQAVLAALRQEMPDLIWMDIDMPLLNGLEAARQIRALGDPQPCIIALTASVFEEQRAEVQEICAALCHKPYREEQLFTLMEEHLGLRFIWQDRQGDGAGAEPRPQAGDLPRALQQLGPQHRQALYQAALTGDIAAAQAVLAALDCAETRSALEHRLANYDLAAIMAGIDALTAIDGTEKAAS